MSERSQGYVVESLRMRLLVAEDNASLGPSLKRRLEVSKYAVDLVTNGEDAVVAGLGVPFDLIILDILLPRLNGFEVCRELRQQGRKMPILLLTALGEVDQRVTGLDLGADDYLVKPFAFRELEARVRALLRRELDVKTIELHFLDLVLNTQTHEVRRGERVIELTSKQYGLLEYMLHHPRQVLTRDMISQHVWDADAAHLSNIIDVYIRLLRRKLCEEGEPDIIRTIRGSGYQLKEP
jgi:DNA-binding response OmpR family regulator